VAHLPCDRELERELKHHFSSVDLINTGGAERPRALYKPKHLPVQSRGSSKPLSPALKQLLVGKLPEALLAPVS
jgi:hypothetical protein